MIDAQNPRLLSEALVLWIGYGVQPIPKRSAERLDARFGEGSSAVLVPVLRHLLTEFWEHDASKRLEDPQEIREAVVQPFREQHPELSDDAVEALYWDYSWNIRW